MSRKLMKISVVYNFIVYVGGGVFCEMEAYTFYLGLLTHSLTYSLIHSLTHSLICRFKIKIKIKNKLFPWVSGLFLTKQQI